MLLKFLIAVVLILGGLTAWQVMATHDAYNQMREAPQHQSIGPDKAKVTIVEFMDYRCNPCRSLNGVMQEVAARHPDVRIVFRHLPVYKEPSVREAKIALAAGKQGKFLAMHELLISRAEPVKDEELPALCTQAGVNCDQLRKAVHDQDVGETLLQTLRAAKILGIHADPTFMIGNTIYTADHRLPTAADFDALIAQASR